MAAQPVVSVRQEPCLAGRVRQLRDSCGALWEATPPVLPAKGPRFGLWRHFTAARAARRLIESLAREVVALPVDEDERRVCVPSLLDWVLTQTTSQANARATRSA